MSFYGNIKRIPASPWVFDKIYSNRKEMEDKIGTNEDQVHIGRYVLINYRLQKGTKTYVEKWKKQGTILTLTTKYQENETADLDKYKDTFDLTVWQKIFSAGQEKYILVSELKANSPRLDLTTIDPIKMVNGNETWTTPSLNRLPALNSSRELINPAPFESENVYQYKFPAPLKIELSDENNNILGGTALVSPKMHEATAEDGSTDFKNTAKWTSGYYSNNTFTPGAKDNGYIEAKKLDIKLYGVGKAIRDIYDVLFGLPAGGADASGQRAGYPSSGSIADALDNRYKSQGLYGVLQSLNIIQTAEEYDENGQWNDSIIQTYFVTRWGEASDNNSAFIQNLPKVITSRNQMTKGHCRLDLTDSNQNYIKYTT